MFDKKVTLKIPEERTVRKKRLGGKEILMYEYMTEAEMVYCMKETISIYYNDNFVANEDAFITPLELFSNLDILALQLCTNVDIADIAFEELLALDAHKFLKNSLGGFEELEKSVMIGVQHVHTMKMLEGLDHVASIDDIEQSMTDVQSILEDGAPEQVKDLLMTQIANNPILSDFYNKVAEIKEREEENGLNE